MNISQELIKVARMIDTNNLKEYQDEAVDKVTKAAKKYGYKVYKVEKAGRTESVYISLEKSGRLPVRVRVSEHGGAAWRGDEVDVYTKIDDIEKSLKKRLTAKEIEVIKEKKEKVGIKHFLNFTKEKGIRTKEAKEHWKMKEDSELYRDWETLVGKDHTIIIEEKYIKLK